MEHANGLPCIFLEKGTNFVVFPEILLHEMRSGRGGDGRPRDSRQYIFPKGTLADESIGNTLQCCRSTRKARLTMPAAIVRRVGEDWMNACSCRIC